MVCFNHKSAEAVGVCVKCGAGVCELCAEARPILCPDCAEEKYLNDIKACKHALLVIYNAIFLSVALLFGLSFLCYILFDSPLAFLINVADAAVFLLCIRSVRARKRNIRNLKEKIEKVRAGKAAHIPDKPSIEQTVIEEMKEEIKEEIKTVIQAASDLARPPVKPGAKAAQQKKLWTCSCGAENPTSKLFCTVCGEKRTKEMIKNAKPRIETSE